MRDIDIWDRIKEIYLKYKNPLLVLLVDFVVIKLFGTPNKEPCVARCLSPISEPMSAINTITFTIAFACFIWIIIINMSD